MGELDCYLHLTNGVSSVGKEQCIPLIKKIIRYSILAKENGLSILEEYVSSDDDAFLRRALTLAIEGVKSSNVNDIMLGLILSNRPTGGNRSVLEKLLICRGVRSIQDGDTPAVTKAVLYSFLGEEYMIEAECIG